VFVRSRIVVGIALLTVPSFIRAFSGSTGAAFLELPTAARPAAMGGAYTALASDAYAIGWNPAGLGVLPNPEVSATHLLHIQNTSNSHLSYVQPLGPRQGVGVSLQYFRPGSITQRDANDRVTGSFDGYAGSFGVGYGYRFSSEWSAGLQIKTIREKIADVSGSAWAGGAGVLYRPLPDWSFGASVDHLGTDLELLQEADDLPQTYRAGAAYLWNKKFTVAVDAVKKKQADVSGHLGLEWRNAQGFAARAGYQTERRRELGAMAGLSVGLAMMFEGHEFAYTWLPASDLGNSHLLSMVFRWGTTIEQQQDDMSLQPADYKTNSELLKDFEKW